MTLAALASLLRHTPGLCRRRWEEGSCTSAVVILLAVAKQIAKDRMSFRVFGMVLENTLGLRLLCLPVYTAKHPVAQLTGGV